MKRHVFLLRLLLLLLHFGPTDADVDRFTMLLESAARESAAIESAARERAALESAARRSAALESAAREMEALKSAARERAASAGLKYNLDNRLIGQHIASRIVWKAVNGFMSNDNPDKPLVLSLHGPTGTGKTFLTKLIAERMYEEGMDSDFFHLFSATYHFPHPKEHLQTYKDQLKQRIKEGVSKCERSVSNCARSMFIFDEVDKMHPDLIDSISPYLDHYANLDGVSYRKSIFIFLSNAGGDVITQTALDFWKSGRHREEIEYKDLEVPLTESLFNDKTTSLYRSNLIYKNMVDFFVPFLPLERRHIILCVNAEMKNIGRRPNQEVAEELAGDLTYYPKTEKAFCSKGCKTVGSKLHFYL